MSDSSLLDKEDGLQGHRLLGDLLDSGWKRPSKMADHPPNSSNWEVMGEAYYRKDEVYQMSWRPGDLSDYKVRGARCGGPIGALAPYPCWGLCGDADCSKLAAITLDTSRPVLLGSTHLGKPKLHIHSSSGRLLQSITWEHTSRLVAFGFTLTDSLIAVSSDGFYRLYPLTSAAGPSTSAGYSQHSLGTAAEDLGVLDAKIWEDGMVVLRGDLGFLEVRGWPTADDDLEDDADQTGFSGKQDLFGHSNVAKGGRIEALESAGLNDPSSCWAVIPPSVSSTRAVQVLVPRGDSVVVVDALEAADQRLSRGPFSRIVPSPNGRFLALLTAHSSPKPGLVWVVSCDFGRELSEFDLNEAAEGQPGMEGLPTQMAWCGGDTVVVAWERVVLMIGPFGASLR